MKTLVFLFALLGLVSTARAQSPLVGSDLRLPSLSTVPSNLAAGTNNAGIWNHSGSFQWVDSTGTSTNILVCGICSASASELTVAGFVHSTVNGIKFPDDTVQITATAPPAFSLVDVAFAPNGQPLLSGAIFTIDRGTGTCLAYGTEFFPTTKTTFTGSREVWNGQSQTNYYELFDLNGDTVVPGSTYSIVMPNAIFPAAPVIVTGGPASPVTLTANHYYVLIGKSSGGDFTRYGGGGSAPDWWKGPTTGMANPPYLQQLPNGAMVMEHGLQANLGTCNSNMPLRADWNDFGSRWAFEPVLR